MAGKLEDRVKEIIVDQLGVNAEQVNLEASFIDDLGADSLDSVELIMAFEEEFGAAIPEEDAEKLREMIESRFEHLKGKIRIYPIGPTIGCHTGPGTLTVFFFGKERTE